MKKNIFRKMIGLLILVIMGSMTTTALGMSRNSPSEDPRSYEWKREAAKQAAEKAREAAKKAREAIKNGTQGQSEGNNVPNVSEAAKKAAEQAREAAKKAAEAAREAAKQ